MHGYLKWTANYNKGTTIQRSNHKSYIGPLETGDCYDNDHVVTCSRHTNTNKEETPLQDYRKS